MSAKLHLLPVGISFAQPEQTHPAAVLRQFASINYYIVEKAKSARAELKRLGYPHPIHQADIRELPERLDTASADALLAPVLAGQDAGLISEAGCPAVADPGALIVRRAHALGIHVVPHVGPSSLLLALMASGLNGQGFAFHGYLPAKTEERTQAIRQLERESAKLKRTQLFIETPYRNNAMMESLLASCEADTLLCVARGLSSPSELVSTRRIADWKQASSPDLDRQPTVFLFLANSSV